MNDLFINTTWFFVLAALVYVILFVYALLKISATARKAALGIWANISKQSFYITISDGIQKYIILPVAGILKKLTGYLGISGRKISGSEGNVLKRIKPLVVEPVNIVSLLFRKLYNDSQTAVIGISAGLIVVFYIILSIF